MLKQMQFGLAVAAMVAASGCAVNGGWMGAEAEKTYDKELETKRLAEVLNNDDYYEIHRDGRIYVLSDAKAYTTFLSTGEIPLVVTRIGAGPKGETLRLALTKNDAKAMEKIVGYKGAAQKMYEGALDGLTKGFFGVVQQEDGTYYVFDNWNALRAFRETGSAAGYNEATEPGGGRVVYVNAAAKPAEAAARFSSLFPKS